MSSSRDTRDTRESRESREPPHDDPRWRSRLLEKFFEFLAAKKVTLDSLLETGREAALPVLFRDFVAAKYAPGSLLYSLDNLMAVHSVIAAGLPVLVAAFAGWEYATDRRAAPLDSCILEAAPPPPNCKARR